MSDAESSSEDENLDLLKEAVDTYFMKDSLYKPNNREGNVLYFNGNLNNSHYLL